jgi:hypothetical protein
MKKYILKQFKSINTIYIIMSTENDKNNVTQSAAPKKRGRKSKKELELAAQQSKIEQNINVIIEESESPSSQSTNTDFLNLPDNNKIISVSKTSNDNASNIDCDNGDKDNHCDDDKDVQVPKKRGRKPKGGKIIQQIVPLNANKETKPNIILHLKCSLKDLINASNNNEVESYNFQPANQLSFDIINGDTNKFSTNHLTVQQHKRNSSACYDDYDDDDDDDDDDNGKESDIRDVWKKLKQLEHNLHINNVCDKKSACFWCTCDFDNPPVYIPKHFIKETYHVYGCFCSPECAVAHLMDENIDSSAKFERYYLVNHIYSKIYDYKKNIKPAPNPYYMLDKFYGNLSIQEYRSLLRNERLFLIVDKPLTRIMPELHEDNDDFIINNKIIPSNTYQIKKKLQKKQTKNTILSERFGLTQ